MTPRSFSGQADLTTSCNVLKCCAEVLVPGIVCWVTDEELPSWCWRANLCGIYKGQVPLG